MMIIIYLTISCISIISRVFGDCPTTITLEAQFNRTNFLRWTNNSVSLICPAYDYANSVWFSESELYKMTVGCVSAEQRSLDLAWFPDVSNISAVFTSERLKSRMMCSFSSANGIIKAEVKNETLHDPLQARVMTLTIYIKPHKTLKTIFYICKKGEVRNGTCRNQFGNGTYYSLKNVLHTNDMYYKITNTITPNHLHKHDCFAKINGTYNILTTTFLKDINECAAAKQENYTLCKVHSSCIDRVLGYQCLNNSYTNLNLCKNKPNWSCPTTATYAYMSKRTCRMDKCIQAANLGIQLCDGGIHDCVDVPESNSYYCKDGVAFIDSCEMLAKEYKWSCPKLSTYALDKMRSSQKLENLLNNAQALNQLNPKYIQNLTATISDDSVRKQLAKNTDKDRYRMANNLLNSFSTNMENRPVSPTTITETAPNKSDPPQPATVSEVDKLQITASLFHLIAEITRQTPNVATLLNSSEANRNGMQFTHLSPDTRSIGLNDTNGHPIHIHVDSKYNDTHDIIVAVIPSSHMLSAETYSNQTHTSHDIDKFAMERRPLMDSNIFLVNTLENISKFSLSLHLDKTPDKVVSCQQSQKQANGHMNLWSEENCETIIVGLHYQCHCVPEQTGTFAIALVYWLGQTNIPLAHLRTINLVNYVFALITIVALFLFLIFTRFIGVFRLDQFNIAFCLMLSAIVSLSIPHVTDKQPIMCTITAVTVCFFPLAAFSWKLIFGLNTLILIVAPHSRYHDLVAKQRHCCTFLWIGYIMPAVIVATWFGYTGQISTGSLCIGPKILRWSFIGPITVVVIFNFIILLIVGFVLLRNYLVTRKSRVNKSTHLLVLTQLMLTLGIPYIAIYIQLLDAYSMLIIVPIAMACTAVLMFLLVAVVDEENRLLFRSFLIAHFTRSSELSILTKGQVKRRSTSSNYSNCRPLHLNRHCSEKRCLSACSSKFMHNGEGGSCETRRNKRRGNQNIHNSAFVSETRSSDLVFEPGWLHRIPMSSQPPQAPQYNQAPSSESFVPTSANSIIQSSLAVSRVYKLGEKVNPNPTGPTINMNNAQMVHEDASSADSSLMKSVII